MPANSINDPRRATPSGAISRPSQKLPRNPTTVTRKYAPTAKSAPCAKFGMLSTPVMSDRPRPIRAYSIPVAIPLRIWPRRRFKLAQEVLLETTDVLAGGVFLRQRRVSRGDHGREVEVFLHRAFRLAAQ